MLLITRVYSFTSDETVVLITILVETVTMQVVCPLMVHTGEEGLMRVKTYGNVVIRNPFYKL